MSRDVIASERGSVQDPAGPPVGEQVDVRVPYDSVHPTHHREVQRTDHYRVTGYALVLLGWPDDPRPALVPVVTWDGGELGRQEVGCPSCGRVEACAEGFAAPLLHTDRPCAWCGRDIGELGRGLTIHAGPGTALSFAPERVNSLVRSPDALARPPVLSSPQDEDA